MTTAAAGRGTGPGTGAKPAGPARRAPLAWLAACTVAAGLVLLAAGRVWTAVRFTPAAGPAGSGRVLLLGGDLVGWLTPAALAALAAAAAVLATRSAARRTIGVVLALTGAAIAAGSVGGMREGAIAAAAREHLASVVVNGAFAAESRVWTWPLAAMVGGLVLTVAGVVAAVGGGSWPGMSSRYDRPRGAGRRGRAGDQAGERALWDAIDEGADPTSDPPASQR